MDCWLLSENSSLDSVKDRELSIGSMEKCNWEKEEEYVFSSTSGELVFESFGICPPPIRRVCVWGL